MVMETEKERRAPKGGFSGHYDEFVSLHPAARFVNFFQAQAGRAESNGTAVQERIDCV
jgi:hypothetical protein